MEKLNATLDVRRIPELKNYHPLFYSLPISSYCNKLKQLRLFDFLMTSIQIFHFFLDHTFHRQEI